MKFFGYLFPAMTLAFSPLSSQVHLDVEGLVVMEIESTPAISKWVMDNAIPGFMGEGYYYWSGSFLGNSGYGVLEYRFKVEQAGIYRVAIRNHNSNQDVTLDNDIFLAMDDEPYHKLYSHGGASWSFHSMLEVGTLHRQPNYNLEAGEHVLRIAARSSNFRIDRIHIYDTSRWEIAAGQSIHHLPSPVEGEEARKAVARIFLEERTKFIPFRVACDGSFSNGEDENPVTGYHWFDGQGLQKSTSAHSRKIFNFFSEGEHEIHLEITDASGNTSAHALSVSGVPRSLGNIGPVSATASAVFANQVPERCIDENLDTSWTFSGTGVHIDFDFVRPMELSSVSVLFKDRDIAGYTFDILSSTDGISFYPLVEGVTTSGNDDAFDKIPIGGTAIRFLRLLVTGSTKSGFISVREVAFEGAYLPPSPLEAWTQTATDYGDGILGFSWLGYFWPMQEGWNFHWQHGWLYGYGYSADSILFWQPSLGWFWTGQEMYPVLYVFDKSRWFWYHVESSIPNRWFFDLAAGQWITERE